MAPRMRWKGEEEERPEIPTNRKTVNHHLEKPPKTSTKAWGLRGAEEQEPGRKCLRNGLG